MGVDKRTAKDRVMCSGNGFRLSVLTMSIIKFFFPPPRSDIASWGLSRVKFLEDTYSPSISRVLQFSYWKGERDHTVARRSFHSIQKVGVANLRLPLVSILLLAMPLSRQSAKSPTIGFSQVKGNSVVSLVYYNRWMSSCCFCKINYKGERRAA